MTCGSGLVKRTRGCQVWSWVDRGVSGPDSQFKIDQVGRNHGNGYYTINATRNNLGIVVASNEKSNHVLNAVKKTINLNECKIVRNSGTYQNPGNFQNLGSYQKPVNHHNFGKSSAEELKPCSNSACFDGCPSDKIYADTCLFRENQCQTCFDIASRGVDTFSTGSKLLICNKKSGLLDGVKCGPKCVCKPGTLMIENGECVTPLNCPCYGYNKTIRVGDTLEIGFCKKCSCLGLGQLNCVDRCEADWNGDGNGGGNGDGNGDEDQNYKTWGNTTKINPSLCDWSSWSTWSSCNKPCNGVQLRIRNSPYQVCQTLENEFIQKKYCSLSNCDRNKVNWSEWSACSASCGQQTQGSKTRYHPKFGQQVMTLGGV